MDLKIKEELKLVQEKYIIHKSLRIYCGTFNVNGKPPDESLAPWLCLNDKHIDIYAIGFQELVDLTTVNLLKQNDSAELCWIYQIEKEICNEKSLRLKAKYKQVCKIRMFGLFLVIYVDEKLLEKNYITNVQRGSLATGLMDLVGNKGSVAVSMKIYESRVCFVCSHFAADTDKLEKRNSDFRSAKLKLSFLNDLGDPTGLSIDDHDSVFWFGDLNYRIDKISLSETLNYINSSNYDELIKFDQLTREKSNQKVFERFEEGRIKFRPTYKYLIKSDVYEKQALLVNSEFNNADNEANSIGKVKLPSWTDRVLWKSFNLKCNLVQYSCINTITISDHKPVYGLFDLELKKIDLKKYMKLYDEAIKKIDRRINEEMPKISLKDWKFDFGECYYYDVKKLQMVVKNEGLTRSKVDVSFFLEKKENSSQWVNVSPHQQEIFEPGSEYIVELRTSFNYTILERIIKQRKLEDYLIVRCLNGNDLFAVVTCTYKPTIIGFSIKGLSTLGANSSIETCDQKEFIDSIENEIGEFEKNLDTKFKECSKNNFINSQCENVEKFMSSLEMDKQKNRKTSSEMVKPLSSLVNSKFEVYDRTLDYLYEDITSQDKYFQLDLAVEYKFFMEHLIERCENNTSDSMSTNSQRTNVTIEEQKNLALINLSKRNFEDFKCFNFDMELLAELLFDLLYALPHGLIPSRYIDYISFMDKEYTKALKFFCFLPKSHCQLFDLIVKFLKTYLKCLDTQESNYTFMIAEAIFQIGKDELAKKYPDTKKQDNCLTVTVHKFLQLFLNYPNQNDQK